MLIFQEILRCFRSPITVRIRVLCRSANGASEIRAGGDTSEKALKVQSSKFSKSHHNSSLPQLALCSPGAQLLQADLGSTLQLRRLRSGRADRIRGGKPPLQSVWVRILWGLGPARGPPWAPGRLIRAPLEKQLADFPWDIPKFKPVWWSQRYFQRWASLSHLPQFHCLPPNWRS